MSTLIAIVTASKLSGSTKFETTPGGGGPAGTVAGFTPGGKGEAMMLEAQLLQSVHNHIYDCDKRYPPVITSMASRVSCV